MKKRTLKYISFGTLAALVVMMMAATVLEKFHGTPFAFRTVYHNPVFIALWGVTAVTGLCYFLANGGGRKFFTMLLHVSFVVILAGALVTHLWGQEGQVRLEQGQTVTSWTTDAGSSRSLPAPLTLQQFEIVRYPGSKAPSDFRSTLTVGTGADARTEVISMNHIAKIDGYRFYQADYDDTASILMVVRDPWGVGITYAGYLLLLVSMIGFFFQKDSAFKQALRRLSKAAAVAAALLVLPLGAQARQPGETPKVLPAEVADAFGDLYAYYNDRICPLETQTRDYTLKAYGKPRWNEFNANQVITGWLFWFNDWQVVPFKVKAKEKGTAKEAEKDLIRRNVASGDALKIFPVRHADGTVSWFSCNDPLPEEVVVDSDHWLFIRKSLDLLEESVRQEDWDQANRLIGKIGEYQRKTAGEFIPSPVKTRAEKAYNRLSRPLIPFMASITLGMILFVLMGFLLARGKAFSGRTVTVLTLIAGVLLLYLTLVLGLRWYVSGHAPFAGSYSVMMLMAWLSALAIVLLGRRFQMILPLGFLLAGFTMLMASLSSANPKITHLMPVLQSPLLSIHVLAMMLSYTLLGLVALNGIMGLVAPKGGPTERLRDLSLVILCPAVFLITFGTFIGAVWANISWGGYWGWDPKETWALITLLVYSVTLHGRVLKIFRNPRFFHAYTILAFLSVLITYFGVNLLLGGMHAYG